MASKKQKIKKAVFHPKITEKGISNILYVFLLAISLSYSALIWGVGELVKTEETPQPKSDIRYSQRENEIKKAVKGYPIEMMSSYISRKDRRVGAFLLGIAKKESNWGKFSPQKDGKDCYNYWGYRGSYNQTLSGYSCFDSPGQAVRVVGARVGELIKKDIDTSRELVIWKCGRDRSCADTPQAEKWIADVDYYYQKF